MNTCEAVRDELIHFVAAQLSADETLTVAKHLAVCADCAQQEAALRRTARLVRQWPAFPLSDEAAARIRAAAQPELARLANRPARTRPEWTWAERWASLLQGAHAARRPLAHAGFAFAALATLFLLIVLIRDFDDAARKGGLFLAGMWCATMAHALLGLVFGETVERGAAAQRWHVDLRATGLSAALAAALVTGMFLVVGLAKMWVGEFVHSLGLRVALHSLASLLIVSGAVAMSQRWLAATVGGRISGAMVGLLYAGFAGPLVYIILGFRLDTNWVIAETAITVCAVAGGLLGDRFALRRRPRSWRRNEG